MSGSKDALNQFYDTWKTRREWASSHNIPFSAYSSVASEAYNRYKQGEDTESAGAMSNDESYLTMEQVASGKQITSTLSHRLAISVIQRQKNPSIGSFSSTACVVMSNFIRVFPSMPSPTLQHSRPATLIRHVRRCAVLPRPQWQARLAVRL